MYIVSGTCDRLKTAVILRTYKFIGISLHHTPAAKTLNLISFLIFFLLNKMCQVRVSDFHYMQKLFYII